MSEIAKVTNVVADGTWNSQYGLLYQWQVTLDNGKSGRVNTKDQKPWFGIDTEVEVKDFKQGTDQNGNPWTSMKLGKPEASGGQQNYSGGGSQKGSSNTSKSIVYQHAQKVALEFHIAEGFENQDPAQKIQEVANTAEILAERIIKSVGL